jgi:hypothetical protein
MTVAEATEQRERIDTYLERSGLARQSPRVVPLTGDASTGGIPASSSPTRPPSCCRSTRRRSSSRSSVCQCRPLAGSDARADPDVLGHAEDLGVLALEDLGDVTLQAHLGAVTPAEHAAQYRQAVALIATIQRRGSELSNPEFVPYGIAFDVEKLTWEMDFFIKHFIEAYRGVVIPPSARDALREELATIIAELAAETRVLCHRDYHSRNLMLHQDKLYIITRMPNGALRSSRPPRFPNRSDRADRRRPHCLFPRFER